MGLRYSPAPSSDFLFSLIYNDFEDKVSDSFDTFFGPVETLGKSHDKGFQAEGQHLYRQGRLNLTTGGAFSNFDRDVDLPPRCRIRSQISTNSFSEQVHDIHPYVYGNLNFPDPMTFTVGLSYDDYEQGDIKVDKLNPKLGAQWFVTDDLLLRGAVFQTVKPLLANNRTLEPTQVAGFNQLFDEDNGTKALRYGVGLDHRLTNNLFIGGESTWGDLEVPFVDTASGNVNTVDHDEQTHRAYLHWLPIPQLALSAELVYDRFKAEESVLTIEDVVPRELETISVPLGVRYFHPSGVFAGFGATYVHQEVERSPGGTLELDEGSDDFVLLDAAVGYRLPKRYGIISLSVSNILDQKFHYQDDSFREAQDRPSIGPYFPERLILARITLSW